jgi:hypothetical protein
MQKIFVTWLNGLRTVNQIIRIYRQTQAYIPNVFFEMCL